jgi:hypothetical protein
VRVDRSLHGLRFVGLESLAGKSKLRVFFFFLCEMRPWEVPLLTSLGRAALSSDAAAPTVKMQESLLPNIH